MIDTTPELSRCGRCGSYVLWATRSGYSLAVNPEPVDAQRLARAVVDGRQVYDVRRNERGEIHRLDWHRIGVPLTPDSVVEHECGSAVVYKPVKAPVDPPVPTAAPAVPVGVPRASRPLRDSVTLRDFDASPLPSRSHPCDWCGKPVEIDGVEAYVAIELGAAVMWACHETCP